jgi:hypothetical protein
MLIQKDGRYREELQQRELEHRRRVLHEAQQRASMQQNRVDSQLQQRNIIEKKLEEYDVVIQRLGENLNKQESDFSTYESKIQEKISGCIKQQLKDEINQYKFEIYRSSLFN